MYPWYSWGRKREVWKLEVVMKGGEDLYPDAPCRYTFIPTLQLTFMDFM